MASSSIRTFLLINLLLSVTLITSLAIIGNLFLAHQDIQSQLDLELLRSTLQLKTAIHGMPPKAIKAHKKQIQATLSPPIQTQNEPISRKVLNAIRSLNRQTAFQLWDKNNHLILKSSTSPSKPFSQGENGFSTIWMANKAWRVYTSLETKQHLILMVAQQSNFREHLENQLTQDSVLIMLITYPFLGFLIWVIVGRGLAPLRKIARAVSHRDPSRLTPLKLTIVPKEIYPLINELNKLFQRLKETLEREQRFAGDAAHELKTPLAALKTQAQVALKAKDDELRKQALVKVIEGVNRSTHVVQQLLTLSRMTPDSVVQDEGPVDLNDKAQEILAILATEAQKKSIQVRLSASKKPALIKANSVSIGILMRNLVDNAIRYTPNNGQVTVAISLEQDRCIFSVTDTGPGIPDDLKQRVFERFFRVMGNRAQGSGLGLGIVSQIIKVHHAEIELLTPKSHSGLTVKVSFKKFS